MIFQELNKLKRRSVMTSIILMFIGVLMIICPRPFIPTMIGALGACLLIAAVLGILEFIGSNKALIHYIYLTGWLILAIIGISVLLFEINSLYKIGWIFGIYLVLTGLSSISHAMTYARRSGRSGWWILIILGLLVVTCGILILVNPWWDTAGKLFKAIGVMMLFTSLADILRLIWLWPIRNE